MIVTQQDYDWTSDASRGLSRLGAKVRETDSHGFYVFSFILDRMDPVTGPANTNRKLALMGAVCRASKAFGDGWWRSCPRVFPA